MCRLLRVLLRLRARGTLMLLHRICPILGLGFSPSWATKTKQGAIPFFVAPSDAPGQAFRKRLPSCDQFQDRIHVALGTRFLSVRAQLHLLARAGFSQVPGSYAGQM